MWLLGKLKSFKRKERGGSTQRPQSNLFKYITLRPQFLTPRALCVY
jgi:hypothetical protein